MIIRKVLVEERVLRKVLSKHGVLFEDVENALLKDAPVYFRTRGDRYMCLALFQRHLTVIFRHSGDAVSIITAYRSSGWQRKLYTRKSKR